MTARVGLHRAVAEIIVKGDGSPRSAAQIVTQVADALDRAHEAGRVEGSAGARVAMLRESLEIARGTEQAAHARVAMLEREIAQAGK